MPRLRRSDCAAPGISRVRHGRGFRYLGPDGAAVADDETLQRIADLAIPPAWQDVWICPHANGHIQAVGTDAAGRRQYRYHDAWRTRRDREKHDRMLEFAAVLPRARARAQADLAQSEVTKTRVLGAAFRLLDLGFFRVGSEEYAKRNASFGLATIQRRHVRISQDGVVTFDYQAKSGKRRVQSVADEELCELLRILKRRRSGGPDLLMYKAGRTWCDVRSDDINAYLHETTGGEFTAKDFRTWHATVLCAVALAVSTQAPDSATARKRVVSRAVQEVAHYLGNTPAVCRASYIDPRVIDLYNDGVTIAPALYRLGADTHFGQLATQGPVEEATLRMLRDPQQGRRKAS